MVSNTNALSPLYPAAFPVYIARIPTDQPKQEENEYLRSIRQRGLSFIKLEQQAEKEKEKLLKGPFRSSKVVCGSVGWALRPRSPSHILANDLEPPLCSGILTFS